MPKSRREFLATTAASAAALVAGVNAEAQTPAPATTPAAGTPPAFGTAPAVGPEVSAATIAEAQKLVRVERSAAERAQAAGNWRQSMAATMERRTGPRKVAGARARPGHPLESDDPGAGRPVRERFMRSTAPGPLPARDEDIAFAPVTCAFALDRVARAHLRAVDAHLPRADEALRLEAQVRHHGDTRPRARAGTARGCGDSDRELPRPAARDSIRGEGPPRHRRGSATTYGAEPYRDRVPDADAVVVERLAPAPCSWPS